MARRITLKQLANAIRKDGWTQAYGTLFEDKEGFAVDEEGKIIRANIGAACALGQARLNLRLTDKTQWAQFIASARNKTFAQDIINFVVNLNDGEHKPLAVIAQTLEEKYDPKLVLWEQK